MNDLETVRRYMRIRIEANERAFADRGLFENSDAPLVTARCEHHTNGKSPKLAEIAVYKGVLYFASRIDWRPDDHTTRRPWMIEHFFGAGAAGNFDFWNRAMTDDEFLRDCIESQEAQPTMSGDRWIKKTDHWIRYAVPLVNFADFQALGLWTRCKDHPQHAEKLNPVDIVEKLR